MFKPQHYNASEWEAYQKKGYRVHKYLALPLASINRLDAYGFLREGMSVLLSDIKTVDDYSIIAKVSGPDRQNIYLRLDRDYYAMYIKDAEGTVALAEWQFAFPFEGFRQDELWLNMIRVFEAYNSKNCLTPSLPL